MNKVVLTGNIVREPDYRSTQDGTNVCSFTVAVSRRFKDKSGTRPTDFINCVAWRNTAEFIHNYFFKGSPIGIVGEVQTRSYTDKNGNTRHITEVIVNEAEFNGRKAKDESPQEEKPIQEVFPELAEFGTITDDDLPF